MDVMETLNEIMREEYSDYLRERLIIRCKKAKRIRYYQRIKTKV